MKKRIRIFIVGLVTVILVTSFYTISGSARNILKPTKNGIISISLTIDSKIMKVNGKKVEIDPGRDIKPLMIDDKTYIPLRPVIENLGGTASWNEKENRAVFSMGDAKVEMTIGREEIIVNGETKELDTAPQLINGRTFFPVRYIAEFFNCSVDWDEAKNTAIIQKGFFNGDELKDGVLVEIKCKKATVKAGPGEKYAERGKITDESLVGVVNREENWYFIEFIENNEKKRGYVPLSALDGEANVERVLFEKLPAHTTIETKVFSGPGENYSKIWNLPEAKKVIYLDLYKEWAYIEYSAEGFSRRGYIYVDNIVLDKNESAYITTDKELNIYAGPGSSFAKNGVAGAGTDVMIICEENGWCMVQFSDDLGIRRGYVEKSELQYDGDIDTVSYQPEVKKIKNDLCLKAGPSDVFSDVCQVNANQQVSVLDYEESWCFVELEINGEKKRGYLRSDELENPRKITGDKIISDATVWGGPSSEYTEQDYLKADTDIKIFHITDNKMVFIEYMTEDGLKRGYVEYRFIGTSKDIKLNKYDKVNGRIIKKSIVEGGPSSSYADVGFVEVDEMVDVYWTEGDWCFIEFKTNSGKRRGYVEKNKINTDNPETKKNDSDFGPVGRFNSYDPSFPEYKIQKNFISFYAGNNRPRSSGSHIRAIVVHWVGLPGQTAYGTLYYLKRTGRNGSSAHYIVGYNGEVIQALSDDRCAFATGGFKYTPLANSRFVDASGRRRHNDWTLNIETETIDWNGNYYNSTYTSLVRLCADKLNQYGLDTQRDLLRHYDITYKNCPRLFYGVDNDYFKKFKEDVEKARKRK